MRWQRGEIPYRIGGAVGRGAMRGTGGLPLRAGSMVRVKHSLPVPCDQFQPLTPGVEYGG